MFKLWCEWGISLYTVGPVSGHLAVHKLFRTLKKVPTLCSQRIIAGEPDVVVWPFMGLRITEKEPHSTSPLRQRFPRKNAVNYEFKAEKSQDKQG